MQCGSSLKKFIRYTVDEEIEFRVECNTGSGDLTDEAVTSESEKTETVESIQCSPQSCERNTTQSLVVRNETTLYEWKLRKAERVSVVQNSLLQLEHSVMPSRSRSRGRKRVDHQAPSVSGNLKKNDQHTEKPSNIPVRDTNGPGTGDTETRVRTRSRSRGHQNEETETRVRTRSRSRGRQNEENLADIAGNAMTGRRSPLIREYMEEGSLQISQLHTIADPKSEAKGSRKQYQYQKETIQKRTRSQSISIDRDASDRSRNTGRGRRMERRSTNTSLSPFCGKTTSPKIEMKANMLDEKKFFVVELVDFMKSGTESPRSVSLSRSTSGFHPEGEGSIARNARSLSRNRKHSKEAVSSKLSPPLDEEIKSPVLICRYCDDEFSSRFDLNEHLVVFHKMKYNTAVLPPSPPPTNPSTSEERKSIMKNPEVERKSVSFGRGESDNPDVQAMTDNVLSSTTSFEHMKDAKISVKKAQKKSRAQKPKDEAKQISHSTPTIDAKSNKGIESKEDSKPSIENTRRTFICDENLRTDAIPENIENETVAEKRMKKTRKRSISNSDHETSRSRSTRSSVQEIYPSIDLHSDIEIKTITKTTTKSIRKRSVSLSGTESDCSDQQPLNDISPSSKVVVYETVCPRKDTDDCTKRKSATVGCNFPMFKESDTSIVIDIPPHSLNLADTNKSETGDQTRMKKKQKKTNSSGTKLKDDSSKGHLTDLQVNSVTSATFHESSEILPDVISNTTSVTVTKEKEVAKSSFNENAADLFKAFNLKKVSVTVKKCDANKSTLSKYIPKNYKSVPIIERKIELPIERESNLVKPAIKVRPYIKDLKKQDEHCVNSEHTYGSYKEKAQNLSTGKETCEMSKSQTDHENDLDVHEKEKNLPNSDSSHLEPIQEKEFVASLYSNKEVLDSSIDSFSNIKTNIESQTSVMKGNETSILDSSYNNKDFEMDADIEDDVLKDFMEQEQIRLDVSSEEQGLLFKDFVEQEQLCLDDGQAELIDSSLIVDLSSATFSAELDECYYNKAKLEAKIDLVYKKYITKHVTNLRTYSKNSVEFNASNEAVLGVESELKVNEKNIAKQAINEEKKMSQQSKENTNSATTRSEKLNKKTLMNTQSEYTATKKPESTALERQSLLPKLPVDVDKDIEKPKVEKNLKSVDIENKEIMSVESVEMNCVTPTPEKLNKKTSKKSQSECTASKNLESTALEQQSALSKLPVNVDQDTEMPQVEMNHNSVDTENVEIASVESVAINSLTPRPEKKLHKKTSKNSKSECTASKKLESTALEQQSALSKLLVNVDKDTEMPQVEMNINSVDTENKEIMSVESVEMNCVTPRPEKLNKKTFKKSQSECTASKKLESTALEKQSALSKLPVNVDQDTEMPQVEMNHNSVDTENEEITSVESVAINSLTPRPEKKLHKKTSKNSKSECTASKKLESTALEQQSALSKLPVNVDKDTEMPQVEMNINSVDTENKEIISDESVTIDSGKLSKKTLNKTKSECNASKKLESTTLEQQSVFSKLPINIDQDTVVPQLEINSKSVDTENKEITSVESVAINTETPRPEKKLHKKTSKNSKSEYTASKKLESLLSKLPVDVDQNTDVPQLDSVTQSPENVDAKSKEIISTETVATNINGSYDNSAKILETIDSVINKVRSENISHEVVSCDETLEINPCSETEDVCNEESNKTSPTEPKSHHSIKIKLKRKRTWLQSVDTPLEECGSLFCDSTQTDDSEPAVKSRKKVESKNTKETVNPHAVEKSKTPVLKLKKVPFSTFTFHNGLRLKFLGSKSKPYWKIKDKHSKATDEIRETFKAYKSSEHNRRKELKMHEKEGIDKETLKHDNIERKNSNFQTIVENNHGEKNVKSKEVASKTCSETEILPNKSTIHDYDEVNNNTICSDDERNMTTEMKCLQNINRVNMEQKVKETPKEVKKDGLKTKKKKDHTNSGSERKIRDDPSKTCSDTKTLTNEITMHDNDEENDNTIRCDSESDTNPETLQNVDGVTVDQKVKETPEKVKKERLKTKIKKDHTKSERKSSKVLKVKILGKKEKVNKEHQLTEFDRVMLNSGKDRKVNLKLAKRSNSIVRRKSDDSESPLESNRDIIFKKSKKRKPVIEDNVSLLSKSKIAQSILNKTEKERKSNEEEIPDFPPITDFESFSFPPLSASKLATKSVNKSPNKHKTSDKSSMKNLMKTLESVGSVRDMINNTKSTRLKDPKSTRLKDIVNGDGLIDLRSPFDSSSSVSFPQSPFINTLRPLESPFGKTDSLKPTNLFKPVSSVAHSEELQGLNKTGVSTEKERDISRNSFSLRPEHFPGESKGSDMNAASRLKQPNFFTDSAFSSPKSFQSGFLSPVSGAFMSNKLPAKPVLISSTPNINLTSVSSPSRKRSFPFSPDGPAEKQQLLEPIDRLFPDISGVGPEAPEEYESSSGGDGEMQKTFMSDNTDSLEIISAEASGILPSSTSLLSDTQIKEAVDWYTNRLKEKEVIKAHKTLTSFLPEGNNDIKEGRVNDIEEGRVQTNAPVALKDRSVTKKSQELNASTTSISKTSLSHVTEKHDASDVVVQSQKMVTGSNTATKIGKFRLKRLETNPVKSCGNDLSFQSLNEQSVETDEEIKVTKGKDKSPTVKNLSDTDAHVDESDKTLSETKVPCDDGAIKENRLESNSEKVILSEKSVETNADGLSSKEKYDDLNKSVSKSNNTKHSDVDSVMKTQTAKIACDIETSNSLFMPDYQDTIQQSVDSVNNSFENETSGLTNETFTSMKSFQTIDETGFQTDVTENLLSPDILKTNPNAQKRTEDANVSNEHEMLDGETTVVDAADETTGAAAGETAEETQDETTDESDSESVLSDKTDSETEEKDDVLSLLASDEDASFLEDESEDDGLVGMGAGKKPTETKPPAYDNEMGSSSKSLRSESSESAGMDVESPSSPSHTAGAAIEINRVDQKQMIRDMIPPSYCFYFHKSGKCKNGNSCRFRHDQPTKEVLVKHWRMKMDQYLGQGELDRSLLLFEQVTREEGMIHPEMVLRMFVVCQQAGNVKCFCLINYMFKHQFLNVDVINKYIYMCGNKQSSESVNNYLWEVFQRMVSLNIQPSNDAMYILLRAFTDSEKWDRLWEVMLYCNEMENFVVPTFCQEKALRAMLKEPNSYFNYAVQFLLNSDVERLHRLDKQLLQEVNNLSQKSGQIKLSQGMKKVLSSRSSTPRPRTPVTPFVEGPGEEEEEYYEDEETVREWMNKFHGLQYSRNWDYMAELYLKRSTIYSPVPDIYINKIVEILKKNEKAVEIFAEFLACTFKRHTIESAENEMVKIDDKGLAMIGNSLLIHYAENQNWQSAFMVLCHMVSNDIEYIKFCGTKREVARVAMETCLQCSQPDAALQVLKETTNAALEASLFQFICILFPNLLHQLQNVMKFHDCVYVLSRAFCVVFKEPPKRDISIVTAVENHTCQLLNKCLHQGDVPVGVKIFALWMEYKRPFVIDTLTSRSLLVACYDNHYEEVTHSVFEMMKRANIYPFQRITKPRNVILPMWLSSQEMYLVVSDYLKWLYNNLCDSLLENVRLTQVDLQLSICFTGQLPPKDEQVPFLHSVAGSLGQLQKMAADVLSQLAPSIGSIIQPNGTILLETASLERWLTETDKKNRRQGLRFSQSIMSRTGINGPARPPRGRGFHRPQRHPIPR